jgi:hypothetical protein
MVRQGNLMRPILFLLATAVPVTFLQSYQFFTAAFLASRESADRLSAAGLMALLIAFSAGPMLMLLLAASGSLLVSGSFLLAGRDSAYPASFRVFAYAVAGGSLVGVFPLAGPAIQAIVTSILCVIGIRRGLETGWISALFLASFTFLACWVPVLGLYYAARLL